MEIWQRTVTALAADIRDGRLTAREVARVSLDRAERLGTRLRSIATLDPDRVLAEAAAADADLAAGRLRGPLHGVPVGIKDICDVAGYETGNGSRLTTGQSGPAAADCVVVGRLRAAGAIVLAKTETHEFAIGGPDPTLPTGPARNPWNLDHYPGGSSSGSGASVAAAIVPAAIGTDTGGSIRIPSAYCGLAGMKPTYGRVSRRGISPLAWSLDHAGPMTWTMTDNALMLNAISGYDAGDPGSAAARVPDFLSGIDAGVAGLRIGVMAGWVEDCAGRLSPEVTAALDAAAGALRAAGAEIGEWRGSPVQDFIAVNRVMLLAEAFTVHEQDFRTRPGIFGPFLRERLAVGALLSAADYIQALRRRQEMIAEFAAAFRDFDLLLCLSGASDAPVAAAQKPGTMLSGLNLTGPFNVTGNPVLSAPCGPDAGGLPASVQIVAAPFQEALAYRAGRVIERALGARDLRPDIAFS